MDKRARLICVGAVVLVLAGAASRHFSRSEPETPANTTLPAAARPSAHAAEHGWIAQSGDSARRRASDAAGVSPSGGYETDDADDRLLQAAALPPMGKRGASLHPAGAAGPHDPGARGAGATRPDTATAPAVAADGAPHDQAGSGDPGTSNQASGPAGQAGAAERSPVYDSGAEARFPTASQFEVPDGGKLTSASGTVSLWLQPGWAEGNQDDASLLELGDQGLHIFKNVDFLRFEFTDSDGVAHGAGTNIDAWQEGEWHNVTATWGNGVISFYADGQPIGERIAAQLDVPSGSQLLIGSNYPPSRPVAPGALAIIQVYDSVSTPAEISARFAQSPLTVR